MISERAIGGSFAIFISAGTKFRPGDDLQRFSAERCGVVEAGISARGARAGPTKAPALGPYFDSDLQFLNTLRVRAPKAEIVVVLQPEHAVMKRIDKWPAKTRACSTSALKHPEGDAFVHAKAIVVEEGENLTVTLGSTNPSEPAWLEGATRRNFEAVVTLRGRRAAQAIRDTGLGQLWKAPSLARKDLEQIAERSRTMDTDPARPGIVPVAGLWRNGWTEFRAEKGLRQVKSIQRFDRAESGAIAMEGAQFDKDTVRFPSPSAGAFAVEFTGKKEPILVIASSAAVLAPSLVSNAAGRLIDELGRLDGGAAPGSELLDLCEKVLLQNDEQEEAGRVTQRQSRHAANAPQAEASGPRGITIEKKPSESRWAVASRFGHFGNYHAATQGPRAI